MSEKKRLHAIVRGIVQGVYFRHYTNLKAQELALVGWVANRKDESVELIAEGTEENLKTFESWLYIGSPDAVVESVESTWQAATGEFTKFKTVHSLE